MPTYEYVCRDCGEHLEVVQSFRDDPLTECEACRGPLRKKFSAAGIVFKGSGYYVTDTRAPDGTSKTVTAASRSEGSDERSGSGGSEGSGSSSTKEASSEGSSGSKGTSERTAPASGATKTTSEAAGS